MVEVKRRTWIAIAACCAILCAFALWASNAFALPYTHSDEEADAGHGVVHIAVTLDSSAVDGFTKRVWLPINADDASVKAVMNEFLNASESKVERFDHEDYNLESMADYLSGHEYEVAVYAASAQQPGADLEYTSKSIGNESYTGLVTGDAVYITVTK